MIKHFCDICGEEITLTPLTVRVGEYYYTDEAELELCSKCAQPLVAAISKVTHE